MSAAFRRVVAVSLMLVAVAVVAPAVHAQSAKTMLPDPEQARLFNSVSDRLVCQCGCQMILRICNHQNCPSAVPMRHEIEKQILEGRGEEDIVQSFVDEHGLKILSSPPAEGLNLAAYIMPGFALLVGLLLIGHFAGHWVARKRLAASGPAPESVDDAMLTRIEEDLRKKAGE